MKSPRFGREPASCIATGHRGEACAPRPPSRPVSRRRWPAIASLLLLLVGIDDAKAATGQGADETLDVRIRVGIDWDDVGKIGKINVWESGRATMTVGGRVKLKAKSDDSLSYAPDSLRATWHWNQVYRVSPDVGGKDACVPGSVLSVERGNGSRRLGPEDMTLEIALGKAAGMLAAVYGGSADVDGMFVLMVKNLIETSVSHQQSDCFPAPFPAAKQGKRHLLLHVQGTMKDGRIRGNHSWRQQEKVSFSSLEAQILNFGPKPVISGHAPGGNVRVHATYRLGKPQALVIQRKEFGTWHDITHAEGDDPWDVLPGERMDLRAVVRPEEKVVADGRWTIPEPVVEDWVVEGGKKGHDTASVDPLDPKERLGGSLRFHWWGESEEKTVTVETTEGGRKRAEARFRLVSPETVVHTVVPTEAKFQVEMILPAGNQHLACLVDGEPTITFRHPPLSWTTPGETQYVQLVKTDARTEMDPDRSMMGSCMELHVEGLDTTYPYAPGPRAADNPESPAASYDLKLSVAHEFKMHLMYLPDTPDAIWVPLRVVDWKWIGKATREKASGKWDCSGSSITRQPSDAAAKHFPTWTRVVTEGLKWAPCDK